MPQSRFSQIVIPHPTDEQGRGRLSYISISAVLFPHPKSTVNLPSPLLKRGTPTEKALLLLLAMAIVAGCKNVFAITGRMNAFL